LFQRVVEAVSLLSNHVAFSSQTPSKLNNLREKLKNSEEEVASLNEIIEWQNALLLEASQRQSLLHEKEVEYEWLRKDLVGSIDRICLLKTKIASSESKNVELSEDLKKTKEASALTNSELSTLEDKPHRLSPYMTRSTRS
jgi:chromosome segregation ATPase